MLATASFSSKTKKWNSRRRAGEDELLLPLLMLLAMMMGRGGCLRAERKWIVSLEMRSHCVLCLPYQICTLYSCCFCSTICSFGKCSCCYTLRHPPSLTFGDDTQVKKWTNAAGDDTYWQYLLITDKLHQRSVWWTLATFHRLSWVPIESSQSEAVQRMMPIRKTDTLLFSLITHTFCTSVCCLCL